jgi:hypothetical protein
LTEKLCLRGSLDCTSESGSALSVHQLVAMHNKRPIDMLALSGTLQGKFIKNDLDILACVQPSYVSLIRVLGDELSFELLTRASRDDLFRGPRVDFDTQRVTSDLHASSCLRPHAVRAVCDQRRIAIFRDPVGRLRRAFITRLSEASRPIGSPSFRGHSSAGRRMNPAG